MCLCVNVYSELSVHTCTCMCYIASQSYLAMYNLQIVLFLSFPKYFLFKNPCHKKGNWQSHPWQCAILRVCPIITLHLAAVRWAAGFAPVLLLTCLLSCSSCLHLVRFSELTCFTLKMIKQWYKQVQLKQQIEQKTWVGKGAASSDERESRAVVCVRERNPDEN